MSNGRLVLHTSCEEPNPGRPTMLARLSDAGLIGAELTSIADAWLIGEQFLQQVSFLGCSPHLQLVPPSDGSFNFCHIRLRAYPRARLLSARSSHTPRCPECRGALTNWRQLEPAWSVGLIERNLICNGCQMPWRPTLLNWRRSAAVGNLFVEIWGVYPEEAIPQPALLNALGGADEQPWRHFYLLS